MNSFPRSDLESKKKGNEFSVFWGLQSAIDYCTYYEYWILIRLFIFQSHNKQKTEGNRCTWAQFCKFKSPAPEGTVGGIE